MLIKQVDHNGGGDNVRYGDSFTDDEFAGERFDYLLTNPPFGVDWKKQQTEIEREHDKLGFAGRFGAGLPRVNDGALLFLQHMISKFEPVEPDKHKHGSRLAIVFNGSPLFTGGAGSGESDIRKWIIENDWLDAIVALPEQMFYNTGIATYIWVLTNRKAPERRGKVQLIDATSFWTQMRKSLGDKRREIPLDKAKDILTLFRDFKDGETRILEKDGIREEVVVSRVYPTTHFGYRKITVERPLRLNFHASPDRIEALEAERGFLALAQSKKKGEAGSREASEGAALQAAIRALLASLPDTRYRDREEFSFVLDAATKRAGLKLAAPLRKAILSALSERDEGAEICRDSDGAPEPDPELRDTESVPLGVDIYEYFAREVLPHVPDAWIDRSRHDAGDDCVGLVGYEINFNRYFYRYKPPRPLEAIESEIREVEADILRMLGEMNAKV
jgi:type I restriction enzyme M protein